jgi:hypothetical protein
MKLLCKGNHWKVKDGQLLLDTPTGKDEQSARRLVEVLRAQVRLEVYEAICDLKFTGNRKTMMKQSGGNLDNLLLAVQALCADVALGNTNRVGKTPTPSDET